MNKHRFPRFVMVLSFLVLAAVAIGAVAANRYQAAGLPGWAAAPQRLGPGVATGAGSPVGQPATDAGPLEGQMVKMDVSPPLREIEPILQVSDGTIREVGIPGENEAIGQIEMRAEGGDPVLQDGFGSGEAPAPTRNFEGIPNIAGYYPPDTNGEVGLNHYVQMVNVHFQIWDKNGNSLYGPAATNTLWSGFGGPCQTRNDGDPVVLYDQLADRWLITQFTTASPYGECVAVSTGPDPTGSYYRYFFTFASSSSQMYDYPKLGVWPDGYYMAANRFTALFQGASVIALDRSKMLNGQPTMPIEFQSASYSSLLPSDLDGATPPPAGSPNYFMDVSGSSLRLWKFHVDWVNTANSTFTGPTSMTVASFNTLCSGTRSCVAQPGTSVRLDGIGDRLMFRLAYRNFGTHESLVVNRSVDADSTTASRAAVRWYEVRNPNGSPSIYQQGTYAPDTTERWMGSIAMDGSGNMAMVYSASSSSVYPSIRYTGRLAGDPLGQMGADETTLIAGGGYQSGSASRWGDYSDITVDPADDCTFWFTTEYIQANTTAWWRTRIGAFKFPSCGGPSDPPPSVSITSPTGGTVSGSIPVIASASDPGGTVNKVEFFVDGATIGTDTNGGDGWSVTWNTTSVGDGGHSLTAAATDNANQTTTSSPVSVTVDNVVDPVLHVGSLSGSASRVGNKWSATVTISVHDQAHVAVTGATITGTWSNGGSSSCTIVSGTTCQVTKSNINAKNTASVTFTVTNITMTGATYNSSANHATSIVINRP